MTNLQTLYKGSQKIIYGYTLPLLQETVDEIYSEIQRFLLQFELDVNFNKPVMYHKNKCIHTETTSTISFIMRKQFIQCCIKSCDTSQSKFRAFQH